MTRLYKIEGRVFRLDPELYRLARSAGVSRRDLEQEYDFMMKETPGFRFVNFNHAAYSAYIKKRKGRSLFDV